ncbi:pyridoxal-phosphate dependent enzyme [Nocardia blacklockiae]|uniref:pyridoxal-phosphate dependent enzyme n=1 Tax=Nocardia blacklockiae TaxID=480036 RepID=UPI0018941606|nr:pyridoxal-phosphate dependent enzyme [Nocardia blacklockiae]MBF6171081.1 pyridoxal-phosphate dependent enzyme [Nocardia blacklockiae]
MSTGGIGWQPHIVDAWTGIADTIRPVHFEDVDPAALPRSVTGRVVLVREHKQHSGSVHARGALWFLRATRAAGELPAAGVAIAARTESVAAAWAWAARIENAPVALFVPALPAPTVGWLRGGPVTVEVVVDGDPIACRDAYAREVGALVPGPGDPLLAAGSGTWVTGINSLVWRLATVMVPVLDGADGGGLLLGTVTAAHRFGIKTVLVAVEGAAIPVAVQRVLSGDSTEFPGMVSDGHRVSLELVTVPESAVEDAVRMLRQRGRAVTAEGAQAWAAVTTTIEQPRSCYRPAPAESVAVLLAGPPAEADTAERVNPYRLQPKSAAPGADTGR